MITSDCFLNLGNANLTDEVSNFLTSAKFEWGIYIYSAQMTMAHFLNDPLARAIYSRFDVRFNAFMTPPNSYYDFHRDKINGCNINCVLEGFDSATVFREDVASNETRIYDMITMRYIPHVWYAFNPQIPHAVFNHDNKRRIILTISTNLDVGYSEVVEWYKGKFNANDSRH